MDEAYKFMNSPDKDGATIESIGHYTSSPDKLMKDLN